MVVWFKVVGTAKSFL